METPKSKKEEINLDMEVKSDLEMIQDLPPWMESSLTKFFLPLANLTLTISLLT
jgi:hypothetical protein